MLKSGERDGARTRDLRRDRPGDRLDIFTKTLEFWTPENRGTHHETLTPMSPVDTGHWRRLESGEG